MTPTIEEHEKRITALEQKVNGVFSKELQNLEKQLHKCDTEKPQEE